MAGFQISIGEINIICTDLDRSLWFYRDVLGFEALEMEDGAYHLRCGQTQVLLLPIAKEGPARPPYGRYPEISVDLIVDDLEGFLEYLAREAPDTPIARQDGGRFAIIRDPDGLVLEVIQRQE